MYKKWAYDWENNMFKLLGRQMANNVSSANYITILWYEQTSPMYKEAKSKMLTSPNDNTTSIFNSLSLIDPVGFVIFWKCHS